MDIARVTGSENDAELWTATSWRRRTVLAAALTIKKSAEWTGAPKGLALVECAATTARDGSVVGTTATARCMYAVCARSTSAATASDSGHARRGNRLTRANRYYVLKVSGKLEGRASAMVSSALERRHIDLKLLLESRLKTALNICHLTCKCLTRLMLRLVLIPPFLEAAPRALPGDHLHCQQMQRRERYSELQSMARTARCQPPDWHGHHAVTAIRPA